MIDGVYEIRTTGAVVFHPVPGPTDEDVAAVAEQIYRKVTRALDARGDHDGTALASAEPVLATLAGASVAGVAAMGPRRGVRTLRLGSGTTLGASITGRRCAAVEGFSLHANVRVAANDRDGLEHLTRYLARPPVATDRLTLLPDGRAALRFKRPFADGTEAVVFTPFELIERLLPLIPRPRKHTIRFHGILAPAAGHRSKVVPASEAPTPAKKNLHRSGPHHTGSPGPSCCVGSFSLTRSTARAAMAACESSQPSPSRAPSNASSATSARGPCRPASLVPAPRRIARRPSSAKSTSETLTLMKALRVDPRGRRGETAR